MVYSREFERYDQRYLQWFFSGFKISGKNKLCFHRRYCRQHWQKTYQNLSQTSEGNVSSGSASWKQQQERESFFKYIHARSLFIDAPSFLRETRYCKRNIKVLKDLGEKVYTYNSRKTQRYHPLIIQETAKCDRTFCTSSL